MEGAGLCRKLYEERGKALQEGRRGMTGEHRETEPGVRTIGGSLCRQLIGGEVGEEAW